jgi:hypothetical protein
MRAESRGRLAAAQAAIVRSVALKEPPPEGFDRSRVAAAADALIRKRARAVALAWPALARSLGESFDERFAAHTKATPLPLEGTPLEDGRAFARALALAGVLPENGRLELLAVDSRYVLRADTLIARRGFAIRAVWLKQRRRVAVVMRLPLVGELWLGLRIPSLL